MRSVSGVRASFAVRPEKRLGCQLVTSFLLTQSHPSRTTLRASCPRLARVLPRFKQPSGAAMAKDGGAARPEVRSPAANKLYLLQSLGVKDTSPHPLCRTNVEMELIRISPR